MSKCNCIPPPPMTAKPNGPTPVRLLIGLLLVTCVWGQLQQCSAARASGAYDVRITNLGELTREVQALRTQGVKCR